MFLIRFRVPDAFDCKSIESESAIMILVSYTFSDEPVNSEPSACICAFGYVSCRRMM